MTVLERSCRCCSLRLGCIQRCNHHNHQERTSRQGQGLLQQLIPGGMMPMAFPSCRTSTPTATTVQPTTIICTIHGGKYVPGMTLYDNIAAILQTGFTMRHNISAEARYGHVSPCALQRLTLDQQGVVKTSDFSRFNLSLSGKAEVTKWLTR
ncbi:MAG: hypothetical protein MZV63_21470 [Marinilabiliales bacterium]|nr:hypothetical protein [Marinilabiliales bacterium]